MLKFSRLVNLTLGVLSLLIVYSLIMTKSSISQKKKHLGTLSQHLEEAHDWQNALEAELNLLQSRPYLSALAEARFGDGLVSAAQEIHVQDLPDRDPGQAGHRQALALFAEAVASQEPAATPAPPHVAIPSSLDNSPLIGRLIQHIQGQGSRN